ncbi:MAG TPA: HAD-IIB family hydrolase [Polyangia bacterium]|nr:HAD-IIB family hydrolase [Polyangia bacterium]
MRFHVLATDYDGTIAHHGVVDAATQEALARVRASGRKLILVTGRELVDLQRVFPAIELFDAIVAENGAVIYQPAQRCSRHVGEKPPEIFAQRLRERGVSPLSVGEVIVATWQPHEAVVLETIRELGLELQVIFNKGAVMVLPSGVNKAVGLRGALEDLGLSPHNAVGVGDAENDHAFLSVCECSVAVANALDSLKERADMVTAADHGAGVSELAERMIASDLADLAGRLQRHSLVLGADEGGNELRIPVHGSPVLVAGTSGGGKSTLASGLIEQLGEQGYQFCIVDPEGDFADLPNVPSLGDAKHAPTVNEVMEVLTPPSQNASVNLLGVPLADRPAYFEALLLHLHELRTRTGRPHWLIVDEAHHLLPDSRSGTQALPRDPLTGVLLITVHPEHVSRGVLDDVSTVIAIGASPAETLAAFASKIEGAPPPVPAEPLPAGEALVWFRRDGDRAVRYHVHTPHFERRRHVRKYAAGELGPDKSFFFRGPDAKLNLRAQNLQMFLQVADGVDDETWLYHLRRGDYSRWFREAIKDQELADEVAQIEGDRGADPAVTRGRMHAAIESRYTAAA